MTRPRNALPDLRWHANSKQWCVYRDGRRIRLGNDRAQAELRRAALIAEWSGQPFESPPDPRSLSLAEALALYRRHLIEIGTDKRKLARVDAAVLANKSQWEMLVASYRGPALKFMRSELVKRKDKRTGLHLSRRYINHLVDAIVLAFRWFVAHDLAPADNLARLREMSAELSESGGGRETGKIPAVADDTISRTLPLCSPVVAAMVRIQQAAGMRPGELCSMRRGDLSTRPDEFVAIAGMDKRVAAIAAGGELIWLYCPRKHKNLHRSKPRVVALGTRAQEFLRPLLASLGPEDFVFRAERGKPYTPAAYGNAIGRAIAKANGKPGAAKIPRWSPQQLRKSAAKRVDAVMGADGADKAAAMLGHSASRQALDFYIAEQIEKAVAAAAKAG